MRPDYLQVASLTVADHYPGAIGAFVAGSVTRGEATPGSDIDVVVLFDQPFEDVHRNSVVADYWPIEFFVHNLQSLSFYMDADRKRGMCIMPTMVAEGIVIPEATDRMLLAKDRAHAVIAAGPPALTTADLDFGRYAITDLSDDLRDAAAPATRNAVLSHLHERLGDFHLRAGGHWSGYGKALLRCLKQQHAEFALRFEDSFAAAFRGQGLTDVYDLVDEVLTPHGGRLWEGYSSAATPDWKEFREEDVD